MITAATFNAIFTACLLVAVVGMLVGMIGTFTARRGTVLQYYLTVIAAFCGFSTFVCFVCVVLTRVGLP